MKFFNLDCHASVIEDVKFIFNNLGHEIVDWSLSGHAHVMNKEQREIKLVDGTILKGCPWASRENAKVFYETFKDDFSIYDGFICCYPVEFCIFFELWNKPIIIINCIRYEHPFTRNKDRWNELNDVLLSLNDKKLLHFVSNNKGDQIYSEYFLKKISPIWIPSLCEYTKSYYKPEKKKFIITTRSHIDNVNHELCVHIGNLKPYTWEDTYKYKGFIFNPYHNGCMTIFECYTANIPMFFPSKEFGKKLLKQGLMFQDLTFYKIYGEKEPTEIDNPNNLSNPKNIDMWFDTCDFYDQENMPYCIYYNSFEELNDIIKTISDDELNEISNKMKDFNIKRKKIVYDKWSKILENL